MTDTTYVLKDIHIHPSMITASKVHHRIKPSIVCCSNYHISLSINHPMNCNCTVSMPIKIVTTPWIVTALQTLQKPAQSMLTAPMNYKPTRLQPLYACITTYIHVFVWFIEFTGYYDDAVRSTTQRAVWQAAWECSVAGCFNSNRPLNCNRSKIALKAQ